MGIFFFSLRFPNNIPFFFFLFPSCPYNRRHGFQSDVRYGSRLPGHGSRRSARLHRGAATAGQRPAARVIAKAGQSVGIHGLPRRVKKIILFIFYFFTNFICRPFVCRRLKRLRIIDDRALSFVFTIIVYHYCYYRRRLEAPPILLGVYD